jgi:hypothetical protein
MKPTFALTSDQLEFYRKHGYLAIPSITTPEELEVLRKIHDEMFEAKLGFREGNHFDFAGDETNGEFAYPQMLMPSNYRPELADTILRSRGLSIAQQILGTDAKFILDHAFRKPPGGPATPWHQDVAFYQVGTRHDTFTIWVPLDDVDPRNGCMEFVPGSHQGPLLRHRSINDDPRIHGIEAAGVNASRAVPCPLEAGGATLHHRSTLHYTAPNVAGAARRAYALIFGVKTKTVFVRSAHPWMAEKKTARIERERASVSAVTRALRALKSALGKAGLIVTKAPDGSFSFMIRRRT